jgi:uncharacterized protein YciI
MKRISILMGRSFMLLIILSACEEKNSNLNNKSDDVSSGNTLSYDSAKAAEYGADAYGMKKYVMAFLRKGPNRNLDSTEAANLQMAHLENIGKMAEAGKLVLAGPFFGDGDIREIYIFNVESLAEAEELTNSDPAIQAGSLVMDLKEWYGSAGLVAVNEIHKTLAKEGILDE